MDSTNPLARHGGLSYLEIPALEPRKSADFYEQVFRWRIDRRARENFRFSDPKGFLIGRWTMTDRASAAAGLLPFIYVESIDAALETVAASGGQVVKSPYSEGDVRVATVHDPARNLLGLWQFASR
jgi:uncharacterized protein